MSKFPTVISWVCPTCDKPGKTPKEYTQEEFLIHLTQVHDIREEKGKKNLVSHMKFSGGHHSYQWEWTLGGMKFMQFENR